MATISKYFFVTSGLLVLTGASVSAQGGETASVKTMSDQTFLLIIIGILLFALLVMAMVLLRMSNLVREIKKESSYVKRQSGFAAWWNKLDKKIFTKAVPVEKEADVLMDHDYDGIKELDNALPPWWKWGFYLTLIVGVFYLLRFHVWKTGPAPEEEYAREMQLAAVRLEKNKSNTGEELNENTVTLADAAGIAEGKKLFMGVCNTCHGNNGEGNAIGPNLTDKYWLHGGSINDVFRTIVNGVPEKGMQSWKKNYTSAEIRNLASYILSLQGSNPPNAKAPQGELYTGVPAADSSAVKKDTTAVK